MYGAEIWGVATKKEWARNMLNAVQRRIAFRVVSGYRTVSTSAAQVIAALIPIDLLIQERMEKREGVLDKDQLRERTYQKLQERWETTDKGV